MKYICFGESTNNAFIDIGCKSQYECESSNVEITALEQHAAINSIKNNTYT